MDADLDLLFKSSKPAALPEVKAAKLPRFEELIKEPTVSEETPEAKPVLSRRQKEKAIAEPEERLKRTLFVGNLPIECCKSKGFDKALPRKIAFITQQFHQDRDSVNAYIVMETEENAQAALKENATTFEGRHIRVDLASKERKNDTKKSVFVGNLPFNVTEEKLWEFFGTCGQISNVRLDKSSIELALQLAGGECAGRAIRISKCTKEGYHKETQAHKLKRMTVRQNKPEATGADAEKTTKVKPAAGFAKKCASVAPVYVAKGKGAVSKVKKQTACPAYAKVDKKRTIKKVPRKAQN